MEKEKLKRIIQFLEAKEEHSAPLLWKHKNITVLPHISAHTDVDTASDIVCKNIKSYRLTSKIPKSVDLKRGY